MIKGRKIKLKTMRPQGLRRLIRLDFKHGFQKNGRGRNR